MSLLLLLLLLLLLHFWTPHIAASINIVIEIVHGCNSLFFSDHGMMDKTAFPLWRAMELRWNRNIVSPEPKFLHILNFSTRELLDIELHDDRQRPDRKSPASNARAMLKGQWCGYAVMWKAFSLVTVCHWRPMHNCVCIFGCWSCSCI